MAVIVGKGTVINVELAGVMTPFAQVTSATGLDFKAETVEITNFNGGAGKRFYHTGFNDISDLTVEFNLDPDHSVFKDCLAKIVEPQLVNLEIIFSNDKEWAISGYLGISVNIQRNDVVKGTLTVKIDGQPNYNL